MEEIPALDLKTQYQNLREKFEPAVLGVLERGHYILGEAVTTFEKDFAAYCGTAAAIGVASGTDAIQLALMACDIGPGDEVITVSHTAVATVAAIEMTGARPVLVDIDPVRYTLDPKKFEAAITSKTRAVIPVHLYGCPADLAPIIEIANAKNIIVIEDCAQAHGAMYHGRKVGSWGAMATFSFYPTKNLGAYGDGGALVTSDASLADRARALRQYGWVERYVSNIKGMNSRLDDLQAAILSVKLPHLDEWNARRQQLACLYSNFLTGCGVNLPFQPPDTSHVYHQFVIRHAERDNLKAFLLENKIHSLIHYPVPIHLQPAYANLGIARGDLPVTEQAAQQVLSLPLYPEMSEESVELVSRAVIEFCRAHRESA